MEQTLYLQGATTLLHAEQRPGVTMASLFLTPRYVFVLPEFSAKAMPVHLLDFFKRHDHEHTWRQVIMQGGIPLQELEQALAGALAPDEVFELVELGAYRMRGQTFGYKELGGYTWDGFGVIGQEAAAATMNFLESHRHLVREAAKSRTPVTPLKAPFRQGTKQFLAGAGLLLIGIACGIWLSWGLGFAPVGMGAALMAAGGWDMTVGRPMNPRTRREMGSSASSRLVLVLMVFALATFATLALALYDHFKS